MKVFKKKYLPDVLLYKGEYYTLDIALTILQSTRAYLNDEDTKAKIKKAVRVQVLPQSLKGKRDLYGHPYQPNDHLYSKLPKVVINGREYSVKQFYTAQDTNEFMQNNPGWGVIHEQKDPHLISVARCDDKGTPVK